MKRICGRWATVAFVAVMVGGWTTVGKAQTVLESSSWNVERKTGGTPQKGAFRIEDGLIYHLDQDHPVGEAAIDAQGRLLLFFQGHRKFNGRAIVAKSSQACGKGRSS